MTERLNRLGVDLVLELAEYNAPRRCRQCKADARYYVFSEDVHSTYCCEDYLDNAMERVQA